MTVGILGAGQLGSNLAKALSLKNMPCVLANRRGPASLTNLVAELGPSVTAGTALEAAHCDIVVLAMQWRDVPLAVEGLIEWEGRVVIDATNPLIAIEPGSAEATDPKNPFGAFGFRLADTGGRPSSVLVSEMMPGALLVKAFNHFAVEELPQPVPFGKRVIFYSGDEPVSKAQVGALIDQLGMAPVDLGSIGDGGRLAEAPSGPLSFATYVRL
ncbi:NADP oxidoreductase [Rhizobium leguminosarum]|nr:NADP oxidoreductase [Rhizobium leguminosarum]